jgi:hypothetical protein
VKIKQTIGMLSASVAKRAMLESLLSSISRHSLNEKNQSDYITGNALFVDGGIMLYAGFRTGG